jgi:hypothetical protein
METLCFSRFENVFQSYINQTGKKPHTNQWNRIESQDQMSDMQKKKRIEGQE